MILQTRPLSFELGNIYAVEVETCLCSLGCRHVHAMDKAQARRAKPDPNQDQIVPKDQTRTSGLIEADVAEQVDWQRKHLHHQSQPEGELGSCRCGPPPMDFLA
jgi:hypothetical protein